MKPSNNRLRIAALLLAAVLLIVAIVFEIFFAVLRTSPRIDRMTLVDSPSVVAVITPSAIIDHLLPLVRERTIFPIPAWLIRRNLPYEVTLLTASDYDNDEVDLTFFINTPHLAPALLRRIGKVDLGAEVPEIQWAPEGARNETPGALTLRGTVLMEQEAQEAAWYLWKQSFKPSPLALEGGHFIEVVMDNRDGGAYLSVASILHAFDIEPNASETDISLSSLKFVTESRMHADVMSNGSLRMYLAIVVKPEAINRLGVLNLKGGIDELLAEWGERLSREHAIGLRGESRWDENTMIFEYEIDKAEELLRLALDGELF